MSSFQYPDREFGVMPFWFINDELDEAELRRQIADFEEHGVYGFVIHPRIGLPRKLGWMSPELLGYYRIILDEATKRQMRVILYDEAMYPSGSSCGQVVAANPSHHCRCLDHIELPSGQEPVLKPDENLVAIIDTVSHGRLAVIDRRADSVIRGLHYVGDGPAEDEPPAADLLNSAAVDSFINLVYEKFYRELKPYFASTIIGIFTDEPNLLGRCRESGIMPGTTGILEEINRILGYDFTPHLPALWYDDEPEAIRYRAAYLTAVNTRFEETWYARLSEWCSKHNTALAGHPAASDEIGALRYFHIPGQDTVWREILPDTPSALEGPGSTQAKCSSSSMIHQRRRFNLNECCGAYGHEMTYEEMEWLSYWCLIRGVNLLVPHAFYYSVRGIRRDERPPDVGPNSSWWNQYRSYADSCRRLSWLNTDSTHVAAVAILTASHHAPWRAAQVCFQQQFDFNYLEERLLREDTTIDEDGIVVADMRYRLLITENETAPELDGILARLEQDGRLFRYIPGREEELLSRLQTMVPKTFEFIPPSPALRVREIVKNDRRFLIIFNENATTVDSVLRLKENLPATHHDPVTGCALRLDNPAVIKLTGHQIMVVSTAVKPA